MKKEDINYSSLHVSPCFSRELKLAKISLISLSREKERERNFPRFRSFLLSKLLLVLGMLMRSRNSKYPRRTVNTSEKMKLGS